MTVYRIRFEGSAAHVVDVATAIADADGVELTSSEPVSILDENTVRLDVTVEGGFDAVAAAVAFIRHGMPKGSSIEIDGD